MDILQQGADGLGISLDTEQLQKFAAYYRELMEWNEKFNLTAVTGYEAVVVKHFLDSLTIAGELNGAEGRSVIDVGSGAGFPGIPLAVVLPGCKMTLLEATGKKTLFLRHMVEVLGLTNIVVVNARAEDCAHIAHYREKFDFVLARAVAPLNVLAELMLPLCAVGGTCISQKKGDVDPEVAGALSAIGKLGGKLRGCKLVGIPPETDNRYLVLIDKITGTPGRYPRRPGIPAKRPLS